MYELARHPVEETNFTLIGISIFIANFNHHAVQ